jgi:flagellar biosynthetic protein FliQ
VDPDTATDLARQAVMQVLLLGAPVLLVGLAAGLVVGLLQAVTQVHDHTLSFVPKIVAMLIALVVFGPWMMGRITEFATQMFSVAQ